ncbi:FAD-dependent oxidoreductase [uncultured Roseivirga sp.]|jgi:glycine/D-amino acid oxidase-like deaminating enzyme|uniref:NAD(P)/FAD-dependent oxidoreductase n=2 Tax=Roseivirga TaxID=290180 RepID=UPI00258F7C7C|nr:FAD-dependent oxidoreductase [uncultured Roseivirga sp.]MEC7753990.1 FAD-dependent oxidoreductase [Bacteroidota bacterium]
MLSFWESDFYTSYDHIVVGSGIVGLSTALSIREKLPNARVLVLERGHFPTGASTKNAGFACFGSLSEIAADLEKLSEEEVLKLVQLRWEGLQLLRQRLTDEAIDFRNYGGYELLRANEVGVLEQMDRVNTLLKPLFGQPVYSLVNERIESFGFPKSRVEALVFNPFEAQIHSGRMMKRLTALATSKGVEVMTGAQVVAFEEQSGCVEVALANGPKLRAGQLVFCTNAFTRYFFPHADLEPGRGVVLVTQPIEGLKLKGTYHYDEGYYYFRNYENRVIFGGGRNLDLKTENTTDFNINDRILNQLKSDLQELILPDTRVEIDRVWTGIMAFGPNKKPIVERVSPRITMGVRLGGMGVAIGSKIGQQLAEIVCQ